MGLLSGIHKELLRASAISEPVWRARGYETIERKGELEALGFSKRQQRVPALLIPFYDLRGETVLHQARPDTPRMVVRNHKSKPIKYETPRGARMAMDIPPPVRDKIVDRATPLFVTEGVRKADSAATQGLACIAIAGVFNWRSRDGVVPTWEEIPLKERKTYLGFDSDALENPNVWAALSRLMRFLESRGADVAILNLPPGPSGEKTGLDDFFARGGNVDGLLATARESLPPRPRRANPDGLPEIDAGEGDLRELTDQAVSALERLNDGDDGPAIFRFAGLPARIESDDQGRPVVRELNQSRMRHVLSRAIRWTKETEDGIVPTRPPGDVPLDVLAIPDPPFPVLSRVVSCPIVARDGSVILKRGYHPASRVYYDGSVELEAVPQNPAQEQIDAARRRIAVDLLGDFPFVSAADRANALALFLLPFTRELIDGPTPLHLIEKPSPGTGASLMIEALSLAVTGRTSMTVTEGNDEDEWRKRITAILLNGPQFVVIDNLRRRLDSAALSAVITSGEWSDRVLSTSQVATVPVRCAWVATANNPALSNEMVRRTVSIRLDAKMDRPHARELGSFRHPNLREWVADHRADLITSALTLVNAWFAAGKPRETSVVLGSFEEYTAILGGILRTAGVSEFLANLEDFQNRTDAEGGEWRAFVSAWHEKFGAADVGVAELFELAKSEELGGSVLRPAPTERGERTKFGTDLKKLLDRRYSIDDGHSRSIAVAIRSAGTYQRASRWRLEVFRSVGEPPEDPREPHEPREPSTALADEASDSEPEMAVAAGERDGELV